MKIRITAGTFIGGEPQEVDAMLDLDERVARELINNAKAEKISDGEFAAAQKKKGGNKE